MWGSLRVNWPGASTTVATPTGQTGNTSLLGSTSSSGAPMKRPVSPPINPPRERLEILSAYEGLPQKTKTEPHRHFEGGSITRHCGASFSRLEPMNQSGPIATGYTSGFQASSLAQRRSAPGGGESHASTMTRWASLLARRHQTLLREVSGPHQRSITQTVVISKIKAKRQL